MELGPCFCHKCRENVVIRTNVRGPNPICDKCREAARKGRLARRREKIRAGYNAHNDASGKRYPNKFLITERFCTYCHNGFLPESKSNGRAVCPACVDKKKEQARLNQIDAASRLYWRDPEAAKLKRLARTCERMGLGADWYNLQPKECGICGTDYSGPSGWHIDHDHSCCGDGVRKGCAKCVRGLLCHYCNIGLGCLKDSPELLRAAIRWLEKKPVKLF